MAKGHLKCAECGEYVDQLNTDPRVPPLDVFDCVCDICLDGALDERIEELQEEINDLESKRK